MLHPRESRRRLPVLWLLFLLCLVLDRVDAVESWPTALARMPLGTNVTRLNRTNCVEIMLQAFQSNDLVKALVFMPGATDEFYMFRRAQARLDNSSPSLFDAISALTNQTLIRATFQPPLLLLHTDEDPLDPIIRIEHPPTAARLKQSPFVPHALYNDRDWNFLQPLLEKNCHADIQPWPHLPDSYHFYRHSFAGWNLTCWEALRAVALAGKTTITIRRHLNLILPQRQLVFQGDGRVRATARFDAFPK